MSYSTSQNIQIKGAFSGGYVDNTPESSLNDKFSPYLRNARLDGMATVSRPGHNLFATLTGTGYPLGIGSYLRVVSSGDRLVTRFNTDATHKLYTIDTDGNLTSIVTGANIASDNKMTFQNIGDVIYCMNGSDPFGKLNGTTYTTPVTGVANFAPSFSVVFNSSHFASGWSTNSNKVYKSVGNNYEDFSSTGSDQFTFQETVTGLATNAEALFYFTKNSISVTGVGDIQDIGGAINYTTRGLQVKEGAVNHYSLVSAGNNIYAVTPSNKIIRVTKGQNVDGFEVYELSERENAGISQIMSSLDLDQSNCFGYFLPKDNLIKWYFRSVGATFNDVCIVYDIVHDAFLVDDNCYFYGGVAFKGLYYTISNIEPKVYLDENGFDDEDAPINFRYETKYFDLGAPTRKKEIWEERSYVAINDLASLTQSIIVDGNTVDSITIDETYIPISTGGIGTQAIGTYAIGTGGFAEDDSLYYIDIIRTKGNLQVKGKKVKIVFTNSTVGGRIRLENIEFMIEMLPGIQSNLTQPN